MPTTTRERIKPGPKPQQMQPQNLDPEIRTVAGVSHLTTTRQAAKLLDYVHTPVEERRSCIRIGATVPPKECLKERQAHSIWVVTHPDGSVEVLRRQGDPRATKRWMENRQRPWNTTKTNKPTIVPLARI
jgi:hypothetical protein